MLDAVVSEVPEDADLIALCVPSDLVAQWVITLADHPAPIFDVGSVKSPIIDEIEVSHRYPLVLSRVIRSVDQKRAVPKRQTETCSTVAPSC